MMAAELSEPLDPGVGVRPGEETVEQPGDTHPQHQYQQDQRDWDGDFHISLSPQLQSGVWHDQPEQTVWQKDLAALTIVKIELELCCDDAMIVVTARIISILTSSYQQNITKPLQLIPMSSL